MSKLTGNEQFMNDDISIGFLLSDFWSWNSSDLLNNTLRGALAEFIVTIALDVDTNATIREDWSAYDLLYNECKIEIKSSAYLQSWNDNMISKINFSIRPTRAWSPTEGYEDEVKRQSDIYIFCLFACTDREKANPLLLNQWEFYALRTKVFDEKCPNQKSISLQSLLFLEPVKSNFGSLKESVDELIQSF
ncbi:MAG: hypothetical protein RO469_15670 [Thermincola sp.]|nr:hypothetical protein [Thermincola sp.]